MSSLPTFSDMPTLDRQDASPASASSLDNPMPISAFHSHAIPQTVPSISIPTLQPITGLPSANVPMSVPNLASTDMYGWLPSPAPSTFNFQPTFPSLDTSTNASSALGFSPVSPYPSFGYNYLQNVPAQGPAHHRSRSHCNPADIFGMTPSTASTGMGYEFDLPDIHSTNIASPCSSVESSGSGPSSDDKVALKKEKKTVPTKLTLSMTSKTAPVPLVFGEDEGAEVQDGEAPGPKKRSRTAQACERCRVRKARCFGGNPCNRCIKRKFVCEFTPSRQRGPNKPRSPELPVHPTLNPKTGAGAGAKVRRHSMHAVGSSSASAMATSVAGRFAPIRSRPPPPIPEVVAAPTMGLGLELTPPADDDRTNSKLASAVPRKMTAAARQAAELERLTASFNANSLLSAPHAHPGSASGSGSGSNSVIGSGWTMISGNDLPISNAWVDDDIFRFSPESSSAGGQTGMDEFSSNFEFPWTPNSPQSMSQSLTAAGTGDFEMAQPDLLNMRDDALRQLYGAAPVANESEWFTAY